MNHAYLDPIAAINQPRQDFIRYLLTAYPIKDTALREKLEAQLNQPGIVWQHPYVEGSQPYQVGASLAELVEARILHPAITTLFPINRRLYQHQQAAIAAVVQQQENIVVATGTGSGKTECFLVPMLDRLLKEGEQIATGGVRALILYPMNALVNDQVKRLRQILCKQDPKSPLIRFGFYTSRTLKDPKDALDALRSELQSYDPAELRSLFTEVDKGPNLSTRDLLIEAAIKKISSVQALSRHEIWDNPPQILVTNYSMLEHMLIRPLERSKIFGASSHTFNTLIVDEAHTYDGSTGTEVSMLLKRFKAALNQSEQGRIRCIATSASLGDRSNDEAVKEFAQGLFGEDFAQVIRGSRQDAIARLGSPYTLPSDWQDQAILEALSILEIPQPDAPLKVWKRELSYLVPSEQLEIAEQQANNDFHRLLWFALKQHPLFHRLIDLLSRSPQRWSDIVRSSKLWQVELPRCLDDSLDPDAIQMAEEALSRLLQLGTLARENAQDLPLLPVRIHLLFRGLEGVYGCVKTACREIYLNEKHTCDLCNSPVLELASCAQCGEVYALTQWDSKTRKLLSLPRTNQAVKNNNTSIYTLSVALPQSRVEEEEDEPSEDEDNSNESLTRTFSIVQSPQGWIGEPMLQSFDPQRSKQQKEFHLIWNRHKDDEGIKGCYLPKCATCGSRPNRSQAINRFIAYTDAPLEAMIDSLFELLPESQRRSTEASKRKLLTFSDGRQDAAFFASDFQRNHTETLYRQMVWQAFQAVKNENSSASVKQLTKKLRDLFLETPIAHPDRNASDHHRSYCPTDSFNRLKNELDCEEFAEKRAKELLLREFAIPYARRSSLEAFALLACHIQLKPNASLVEWTAEHLQIPLSEAYIFLLGLTDIIRRSGIVSLQGASNYFPETGGDRNRPAMLDARGKSQQVLFLEKSEDDRKKYPASPAFLPRTKTQNRTGWYFSQLFPTLPSREDFILLFQKLQESGILVNASRGYHLDWECLNVTQTDKDWYQCDRCQQVVHVPGLSEIQPTHLKLHACRAYRCTGTLRPYTLEQMTEHSEQHYQQYLIKQRQPLPLRSQEHTAQLGTEELAKRENDFRQGNINLLSCSTTLEMGVDIGELQAVVMRNFPPHVSNYQQRAGRAGRRTDGVAVTLMYGQRRPHDRFYFEQPEHLIAGANQIPRLDPTNIQIQQRHIRAELFSTFLPIGSEQIRIRDFFELSFDHPIVLPDAKPSATSLSAQFRTWLNHSDEAKNLAQQWLDRLESELSASSLIRAFVEDFDRFVIQQLSDWNELVDLLMELVQDIEALGFNLKERRSLEFRRDGMLTELRKIGSRQLHEQLVQASILPIYGFPIDVVRLLTGEGNEFRSSQGKHRLERDRRLALSEYAPGQDIVVDDRVYQSVGVLRPDDLEQRYYWVCKFCNHFQPFVDPDMTVEQCPTCHQAPKETTDQRVYAYRVPKAFTTDWTKEPEVTPYLKPLRQPTSQVFLASLGNPSESYPHPDNLYNLTSSRGGQFFLANRGAYVSGSQSFCICRKCGRDLTSLIQDQPASTKRKSNRGRTQQQDAKRLLTHKHPLTGKDCNSGYDRLHLGHEFKSDLLKIEFCHPPKRPYPLFGSVAHYQGDRTVDSIADEEQTDISSGRSFWHSLTYALLAAATQVLDIRREELDGLFRPLANGQAEVIIYDNVPGGAGYSRRIAENFDQVLQQAYKLTATCSCQTSCYDCLRTYSNQIFHADLDRYLVAEFLQPLVEVILPDQALQNFAIGANRVSLSAIANELPLLFRSTQSGILYLPSLQDELKLNHNAPIPWLTLLSNAVNSVRQSGTVLKLILHQIPKPDSDVHRFLRKRLVQWMDEGLIELYQSSLDELPTLAIFTCQGMTIALGLSSNESGYEWLQTRHSEGVKAVRQRINQFIQEQVLTSALEDADTTLITPNPSWKNLTLTELRWKLGLEDCLAGGSITKLVYHDRFFYESGAKLFAKLLQSENINVNTKIVIDTRENRRERYPIAASERKRQLEAALAPLCSNGAALKVTVHLEHSSNLEHGRILEIHRASGDSYRVVFDKGIAFIKETPANSYQIQESTYVVIHRFQSK